MLMRSSATTYDFNASVNPYAYGGEALKLSFAPLQQAGFMIVVSKGGLGKIF